MIEAVVRYGSCSELAFVAAITRIILTKDAYGMRDQVFFVHFEEINDIMKVSHPSPCLKL